MPMKHSAAEIAARSGKRMAWARGLDANRISNHASPKHIQSVIEQAVAYICELQTQRDDLVVALVAARNEASSANSQLSTSVHFGDHSTIVRDAKLASHHLILLQNDANAALGHA